MPTRSAPAAQPSVADSQIRLMTKVAHMYHEQGIRQAEIAKTLHISQARVSRLLNRWATARRFAPVRYRAMGMLARFA